MKAPLVVLAALGLTCLPPSHALAPLQPIGGRCDTCEMMFEDMPVSLDWQTVIAPPGEAGEPLELEGVIYQPDGKTPAAGVILYVYQTDARGYYSPAEGQTKARRHGHLRGWMKTGPQGRYKFRTIRPGGYPDRDVPAHIHPIVKEPDKNEYYLDEYRFEDDPRLTKENRAAQEGRGGSGIIRLVKNADGVWMGRRDIVLGRNIPNYM